MTWQEFKDLRNFNYWRWKQGRLMWDSTKLGTARKGPDGKYITEKAWRKLNEN